MEVFERLEAGISQKEGRATWYLIGLYKPSITFPFGKYLETKREFLSAATKGAKLKFFLHIGFEDFHFQQVILLCVAKAAEKSYST